MPEIIIKQPDGKYAIFQTMIDDFTILDATSEEIIEHKKRETEVEYKKYFDDRESGMKHWGFSWEQALKKIQEVHGRNFDINDEHYR